ncbi:hypothetical protein HK096_009869, partial [Nowakowskiella sp. JEL0078]
LNLKQKLQILSNVPAERIKLLGLVKARIPADDACLHDLALLFISEDLDSMPQSKTVKPFSMLGTAEEHEFKEKPVDPSLKSITFENDIEYSDVVKNDEKHRKLLQETVEK